MRFVLALAVLLVLSGPAAAGLTVCNKAAHAARVALGRFDGTHWSSEGWWHIEPGKCTQLLAGNLIARYYYLYASDSAAGGWGGSTNFCVGTAERFSIAGRGGCAQSGFDQRGFFEVDTHNRLDWTQSLSD